MSREAGKGDTPRPIDYRKFEDNWDKINWGGSDKSKVKTDTKKISNNSRKN